MYITTAIRACGTCRLGTVWCSDGLMQKLKLVATAVCLEVERLPNAGRRLFGLAVLFVFATW